MNTKRDFKIQNAKPVPGTYGISVVLRPTIKTYEPVLHATTNSSSERALRMGSASLLELLQ